MEEAYLNNRKRLSHNDLAYMSVSYGGSEEFARILGKQEGSQKTGKRFHDIQIKVKKCLQLVTEKDPCNCAIIC